MKIYTSLLFIMIFSSCFINTLSKIPIIAIVSNNYPSTNTNPTKTQIGNSYVNWIISSGGRVVVINPWDTKETINKVLSYVDGILFQGGSIFIDDKEIYGQTISYILKSVIELQDRNIKTLSIWATCLGFEFIQYIIEKNNVFPEYEFTAEDLVSDNFDINTLKESKMYSFFSDVEYNILQSEAVLNEHHFNGVTQEIYNNSKYLKHFFNILTKTKDTNGVEYINSIEAKNYNIFATQHHPEKTVYDTRELDIAASSFSSMLISKALGSNFISFARQTEDLNIKEKVDLINYLKRYWNDLNDYDLSDIINASFKLTEIIPQTNLPVTTTTNYSYYFFYRNNNESEKTKKQNNVKISENKDNKFMKFLDAEK